MPGWQRFYEKHADKNFELISIALEHGGAELAKPFVEAANATYPVVADEEGLTSRLLDFRLVPNGVLVDEEGVIQYAKYGGFNVDNPDDIAAVERFLAGEDPGPGKPADGPYTLSQTELELVETKMRLGRLLYAQGDKTGALAEWKDALRYDPENLVIRKQIWAAKYPEKFHPTIDWEWQKIQLKTERDAEIAAGICGPDGCPIPVS